MSAGTNTNIDVAGHLKWRYATKRFDPTRKIDSGLWQKVEEALVLTPSSYGLQPWKFIVITDQKMKEELVPATRGQRQPADCSHLVVFCRLTEMTPQHIEHYIARMAEVRQMPEEKLSEFKRTLLDFNSSMPAEKMHNYMARQCYTALGNLMTTAAMYSIDNCPMEGFLPEEYDRILKLHEIGCASVVLCALGYRSSEDKYASLAKVRFAADEVVVHI